MFNKLKSIVLCLGLCAVMAGCYSGCSSLNSNLFHTEQTSVDLVTSGVHDFNQYFKGATNGATPDTIAKLIDARTQVYQATKDFGLSVAQVDALRLEYKTNQAIMPDLQAALTALSAQSTNVSTLVSHFINPAK